MIILIRSILSADSGCQVPRADSSLLIQSGLAPFSNYQHHLDSFPLTVDLLEFKSIFSCCTYMRNESFVTFVCQSCSLSSLLETKWNCMCFPGFPGCCWPAGPKGIHEASSVGRRPCWPSSVCWPGWPLPSFWIPNHIPTQRLDRWPNVPACQELRVFPGHEIFSANSWEGQPFVPDTPGHRQCEST